MNKKLLLAGGITATVAAVATPIAVVYSNKSKTAKATQGPENNKTSGTSGGAINNPQGGGGTTNTPTTGGTDAIAQTNNNHEAISNHLEQTHFIQTSLQSIENKIFTSPGVTGFLARLEDSKNNSLLNFVQHWNSLTGSGKGVASINVLMGSIKAILTSIGKTAKFVAGDDQSVGHAYEHFIDIIFDSETVEQFKNALLHNGQDSGVFGEISSIGAKLFNQEVTGELLGQEHVILDSLKHFHINMELIMAIYAFGMGVAQNVETTNFDLATLMAGPLANDFTNLFAKAPELRGFLSSDDATKLGDLFNHGLTPHDFQLASQYRKTDDAIKDDSRHLDLQGPARERYNAHTKVNSIRQANSLKFFTKLMENIKHELDPVIHANPSWWTEILGEFEMDSLDLIHKMPKSLIASMLNIPLARMHGPLLLKWKEFLNGQKASALAKNNDLLFGTPPSTSAAAQEIVTKIKEIQTWVISDFTSNHNIQDLAADATDAAKAKHAQDIIDRMVAFRSEVETKVHSLSEGLSSNAQSVLSSLLALMKDPKNTDISMVTGILDKEINAYKSVQTANHAIEIADQIQLNPNTFADFVYKLLHGGFGKTVTSPNSKPWQELFLGLDDVLLNLIPKTLFDSSPERISNPTLSGDTRKNIEIILRQAISTMIGPKMDAATFLNPNAPLTNPLATDELFGKVKGNLYVMSHPGPGVSSLTALTSTLNALPSSPSNDLMKRQWKAYIDNMDSETSPSTSVLLSLLKNGLFETIKTKDSLIEGIKEVEWFTLNVALMLANNLQTPSIAGMGLKLGEYFDSLVSFVNTHTEEQALSWMRGHLIGLLMPKISGLAPMISGLPLPDGIKSTLSSIISKINVQATPSETTTKEIAIPYNPQITITEPKFDGGTWSFTSSHYIAPGAILQGKIDNGEWFDLLPTGDKIKDIPDGSVVDFQWVFVDDQNSVWRGNIAPTAPSPITQDSKIFGVLAPSNPQITPTGPKHDGDHWSFTSGSYTAPGAILQYKIDNGKWFDLLPNGDKVQDIPDGSFVDFQWVFEDEQNSVWRDNAAPTAPSPIRQYSNIFGVLAPSNPQITPTGPKFDGDHWSFTSGHYTAPGAILQYKIDNGKWFDLLPNGDKVQDIPDGSVVNFQWVFEDDQNSVWRRNIAPTAPSPIKQDSMIFGAVVPSNPQITLTGPKFDGDHWSFTSGSYTAPGVILQYKIGNGKWFDLLPNGDKIQDIPDGSVVDFQWVFVDDQNSVWRDNAAPTAPSPITTLFGVPAPSNPQITHTHPAVDGGAWSFTSQSYNAPGAILQYQTRAGEWIDLSPKGETVQIKGANLIKFQWVFVDDVNSVWFDGKSPVNPSPIFVISTATQGLLDVREAFMNSHIALAITDYADESTQLGEMDPILAAQNGNVKTSSAIDKLKEMKAWVTQYVIEHPRPSDALESANEEAKNAAQNSIKQWFRQFKIDLGVKMEAIFKNFDSTISATFNLQLSHTNSNTIEKVLKCLEDDIQAFTTMMELNTHIINHEYKMSNPSPTSDAEDNYLV